jgi:hypothetical protein
MLSPVYTWSLTAIAILTAVALLWVWRRFSNRDRIALAKRQTRARLYAMRLYADDPRLIFRTQGELLSWTLRYLAAMQRPMALAIVPLFVLCLQLDDVYGHRLPGPGEAAVVTAQFAGNADVPTPAAKLEGRGVMVESPAVRIPERSQVCWRVRAMGGASGSLVLHVGGTSTSKAFECGHNWGRPPRIEVACPAASLDVLGYAMDWPVWFLLVSLLAMLALRKRFDVVL